jgi:hypothetical protein
VSSLGQVVDVRSYPVKSMDTVSIPSAEVGAAGLAGDRSWSVVGEDGRILSARAVPALLDVRATPGPDGPQLLLPGQASAVSGPDAEAALSAYLGATVRLRPVEGSGQMVAPVHLVSVQAMAQARAGGADDGTECEIEEPRANLTVDLGPDAPDDVERSWLGQQVRLGSVVLRVTALPKHCLGVYAEVVTPGAVNLGDAVETRG